MLGRLVGGAEGDRTPDLRIANAALSQLSYGPGPSRSFGRRGNQDRQDTANPALAAA